MTTVPGCVLSPHFSSPDPAPGRAPLWPVGKEQVMELHASTPSCSRLQSPATGQGKSVGPRASTLTSPPRAPTPRHGAPRGCRRAACPGGFQQDKHRAVSFLPVTASLLPLSLQACPQSTRQGLGGARRGFPEPSEQPALISLSCRLMQGSSSQKCHTPPQGNKHFLDK